jgi:hypothetical protein
LTAPAIFFIYLIIIYSCKKLPAIPLTVHLHNTEPRRVQGGKNAKIDKIDKNS